MRGTRHKARESCTVWTKTPWIDVSALLRQIRWRLQLILGLVHGCMCIDCGHSHNVQVHMYMYQELVLALTFALGLTLTLTIALGKWLSVVVPQSVIW